MISDTVKLTYEEITHVTQEPIVWGIFLAFFIIMIIIAMIFMGVTKSGKTKMIAKKNAWKLFLICSLAYIIAVLFVVFPLWAKIL